MTSVLSRNAAFTSRTRPAVGDTKTAFVNDDHLGWMKCDGRTLSKSQYNLLFQVIGYTFGGAGLTFQLPNAQGRVIGSVGTVTDEVARTRSYGPGQSVGELDHRLTIAEMPSHNHDNNSPPVGSTTVAGNTSTSGNHTHGITDPGHSHSYFNQPNTASPAVSLTTTDVADNVNVNQTTGSSTTGISVNTAGNHYHQIASNGGDQYHNNIQPTLFYGNSFIYCGDPRVGTTNFAVGLNPPLI